MASESYFPSDVTRSMTPWYQWFEHTKPQNTAVTIYSSNFQVYFESVYKEVLTSERALLRHQKYGRRDEQWINDTIARGTFKDKVATITMYMRENPVLGIELLEKLDELCRDKKRHTAEVLPALIELFDITIPVSRPLISLERRCQILKTTDNKYLLPSHKGILTSWYFENYLLQYLHRFLVWVTDELGSDPQEWMRQKSVETMFELLPYPTTSDRCILYILNKMGDPVGSIASCSSARLRAAIYLLYSSQPWTASVVDKESEITRRKFSLYGNDNRIKFMMSCITHAVAFLSRSTINQKTLKVVVSFITFNILPFLQGQSDAEVRLISDLSELFFGLLNRQLAEVCKVTVKDTTIVPMSNKKKNKNKNAKTRTSQTAQMQEFSVLKYILQGLSTSLKYADLKLIGNLEGHVQTLSAMLKATKYHISLLVSTVLLTVAEKARVSGQTRLSADLESQVAKTTINAYYSMLNRFEVAHVTHKSRTGLLLNGMSRALQLTTNNIFLSKNTQAAFWKRCMQVGLVASNGSFVCGSIIFLGMTMTKLHSYGVATAGLNVQSTRSSNTVLKMMPFTASYLASSYGNAKLAAASARNNAHAALPIAQQKSAAEDGQDSKEHTQMRAQTQTDAGVGIKKPTVHLELLSGIASTSTARQSQNQRQIYKRNPATKDDNLKDRRTMQEIEADTNRKYIPEAYNPATSSAANDELWELLILQNHYHLGVQKALNLMIGENTFGRYVRSDAGSYDTLDTTAEFTSKSMTDFIGGRSDYRISRTQYDTARVYPNVCINGAMYEMLAHLYNMKGKEKRIADGRRRDNLDIDRITPQDFFTNYKNKVDIYTDAQRREVVDRMTEEEQDQYIFEAMKQEGIIDAHGRVVDLDSKHMQESKALYVGSQMHDKDAEESSYNLDGDSASYEFCSDVSDGAESAKDRDGEASTEDDYMPEIESQQLSKRERLLMIKKAAGANGFVDADLVYGDEGSDLSIDERPRNRERYSNKAPGKAATGVKLPMHVPEKQVVANYVDSEDSDMREKDNKELLSDSLLPSDGDDYDEEVLKDNVPYVTRAQVKQAPNRNSLQALMQSRARNIKK